MLQITNALIDYKLFTTHYFVYKSGVVYYYLKIVFVQSLVWIYPIESYTVDNHKALSLALYIEQLFVPMKYDIL